MIETKCWGEDKQACVFYAGSDKLDAALLPAVRFGYPNEARLAATRDAVRPELRLGLLYEQNNPASGAVFGNALQALSHLALMHAACVLAPEGGQCPLGEAPTARWTARSLIIWSHNRDCACGQQLQPQIVYQLRMSGLGAKMTAYNLFILNKYDHILTGVDFQSLSDGEAITWASFILPASQIGEIWCGTRRVGRSVDGRFRGSVNALPDRCQSTRKPPAFAARRGEAAVMRQAAE